jgi:sulfur-oxidizing protein SoxB
MMERREFLQGLVAAAVAGLPIDAPRAADGERLYDALEPFGNVGLLHITDCHGQLNPTRFREPSVNLGVGAARGKPPHLVGEALLKHFGIAPGTRARMLSPTSISEHAARVYGAMGGFAHLRR